jgi:hypothetical protein
MMFAVAIGEVGVQTATLVQAHNWVHFLPAYSHLILATIVIAASWVGWTRSPAPGARQDVRGVFQWEFLVLLVDVFLVIVYFILVKTVDFTGEGPIQLKASATPETTWIMVIFVTYFFWDILTKCFMYLKERKNEPWFRNYGSRIIPTIVCLSLALATMSLFNRADSPHTLTVDLALLSLVLLFRALKGLVESLTKPKIPKKWPIFWSLLFFIGFALGTIWTSAWPIPKAIATQIQSLSNGQEPIPPNLSNSIQDLTEE